MKKLRVIIVMGVSGCGKSTVGASLAAAHHGKFHDADDFHTAANIAKMAAGHPLNDADRAPWLASLRQDVVDAAPTGSLTILACSALKKAYRDQLGVGSEGVALVFLKGDFATLTRRLQGRHGHYMKTGMLDSQLATLEAPSMAEGMTVDIDSPVEKIVHAIEVKLAL